MMRGMAETRERRIVRRVVLTIAAVVLLPMWYVVAWFSASQAARVGLIDEAMTKRLAVVFAPIRYYSGSELPGAKVLNDVWWKWHPVFEPGSGITSALYLAPCQKCF
jgi:hypothetical protein